MPSAPEDHDLWVRYKTAGRREERDQLILRYTPLVRFVASRVASGLSSTIEYCDLVSYGTFGLIDAIEKFSLDRNVKFETYAITRIKGAIIDELRTLDWVPRSVRSKARNLERAIARLEAELGRTPVENEVADELGVGVEELRDATWQAALVTTLDHHAGAEDDERQNLADLISDIRMADPESHYTEREIRELLARAAVRMPERAKVVLALYYLENMTLAQIGQVLGVTESRVCQLHTKAVVALRAALGHDVIAA